MKRKTLSVMILLFIMLCLTGCIFKYMNKDEEQALQEGRTALENYLSTNLPDAKILSADVTSARQYVYDRPDLTNYLYGEYEEAGMTYQYYFYIPTQRMYSSKHFSELDEMVQEYILEQGGLSEEDVQEIVSFDVRVILPAEEPYSSSVTVSNGYPDRKECVLPVEVTDVWQYLQDGANREIIDVTLEINVSDTTDLENFPVQKFSNSLRVIGIKITKMTLRKNRAVLEVDNGQELVPIYILKESRVFEGGYEDTGDKPSYNSEYEIWDSLELEDYTVYGEVYHEVGNSDSSLNEQLEFDLSKDLDFHKTNSDYEIRKGSDKRLPKFFLFAKEGSRFLENEYRSKDTNSDKFLECYWRKLPDSDDWVLIDFAGSSFSREKDLRSYGPRQ